MNNQIRRHTAFILLLIYIGYASSVSLFIHSHIYNGVLYVHSHPFNNSSTKKGPLPIESDHHSPHSFFTLNQLSLILASGVKINSFIDVTRPILHFEFNNYIVPNIVTPFIFQFNLRAPPIN